MKKEKEKASTMWGKGAIENFLLQERKSTKWVHKRSWSKPTLTAEQVGSELWWAVTTEKSRRGEPFAGWDLHPVEFKPAGDVLNQTSEHLKINIFISKRPSEKVRSDPCSSYHRHYFSFCVNLIFTYDCEKQMELRKVFSVKFMTP